jgi:hypothetical protein
MRRVIALVIIGLVLAIAIILPAKQDTANMKTEMQLPNYYQHLQECGAVCVPLAAVLVVIAE